MDGLDTQFNQMDLERRPGRRSGCSCCSFAFMGMLALPVLTIVSLWLAL